ncbi:MAG: hypothetical protein IPM54_25135 [Polyangiaceae bacterium]|nr:hypothetical protein [Polyangiaceae bacterium]
MIWLEGPEKHVQEVVGESHYQPQLHRVTGGKACTKDAPILTGAWLIPEFDNPHDDYAVSVWIGDGKVGHLPSYINELEFGKTNDGGDDCLPLTSMAKTDSLKSDPYDGYRTA